jgi:Zn-dependent protease with chaperone function
VNLFLTIVTLGIYPAWAKVRKKRYLYGNTWVADGFAFTLLKRTSRSPRLLGEALAALSTHPPTAERIRAAEEASR